MTKPTDEMKKDFTLVLKGHIAVATARFPEGTTGVAIDDRARKPLYDDNKDYDHGTGHGVGCYLGVHEEAAGISKRGNRYLRTLLVQAAHVLLMRPQNWEKFGFGEWLTNAAARMHRNKLAIALANKLARIAWSVLNTGKAFDTHRIEVEAI